MIDPHSRTETTVTQPDDSTKQPTAFRISDAGLFSFLSHDIRSSFSELSAGLNALSYTSTDPKLREDVRNLIAANDHLGRLLRDALTMVVGEHAIQPPEFGDINIKEFLPTLAQRWKKVVAAQGAKLELHTAPSLPDRMQIDILAVERILSNLVSNAARHANGGLIEIHASCSDTDHLCITVRDYGDGFTQDQLVSLFDFPPAPIGAGEPGSGYGLRIAYSLSTRMGGTLSAQNAPDGGAILSVKLPICERADIGQTLPIETVAALLKGRTALIVDDSAAHRIALRAQLETIGLSVEEADCGADVIALLQRKTFDLLFLDIELPIFSGIDLLHSLKKRNVNLPATIGVTAHAFERNHAAIKDAGALIVLNKPVSNAASLHNATLSALQLAKPYKDQSLKIEPNVLFDQKQQPKSLEALITKLNPPTRNAFLSQLELEFETLIAQAQAITANDMTDTDKRILSGTAHALAGLFATSYSSAAHHRSLHLERAVFSDTQSQIIALLDTLRQDAHHIIKTIHLLKDKK